MAQEIIDISMPLRSGMLHWPSDPPVSVEPFKYPAKGDRSRVSRLIMGTHTGTHVDAPRHYLPDGEGVDRIPLEHLIGPCEVVDCRGRRSISQKDVARLDLRAVPRVLFGTDNSAKAKGDEFFEDFVYVEEEAAVWLARHGACLVGVDGFSVDKYHGPAPSSHLAFMKSGVTILEGLLLDNVEPGRYQLICLPLRLKEGDGAPARAVLLRTNQ